MEKVNAIVGRAAPRPLSAHHVHGVGIGVDHRSAGDSHEAVVGFRTDFLIEPAVNLNGARSIELPLPHHASRGIGVGIADIESINPVLGGSDEKQILHTGGCRAHRPHVERLGQHVSLDVARVTPPEPPRPDVARP